MNPITNAPEAYADWRKRVMAEHKAQMERLAESTRRYRAFNDGLAKRLSEPPTRKVAR